MVGRRLAIRSRPINSCCVTLLPTIPLDLPPTHLTTARHTTKGGSASSSPLASADVTPVLHCSIASSEEIRQHGFIRRYGLRRLIADTQSRRCAIRHLWQHQLDRLDLPSRASFWSVSEARELRFRAPSLLTLRVASPAYRQLQGAKRRWPLHGLPHRLAPR